MCCNESAHARANDSGRRSRLFWHLVTGNRVWSNTWDSPRTLLLLFFLLLIIIIIIVIVIFVVRTVTQKNMFVMMIICVRVMYYRCHYYGYHLYHCYHCCNTFTINVTISIVLIVLIVLSSRLVSLLSNCYHSRSWCHTSHDLVSGFRRVIYHSKKSVVPLVLEHA